MSASAWGISKATAAEVEVSRDEALDGLVERQPVRGSGVVVNLGEVKRSIRGRGVVGNASGIPIFVVEGVALPAPGTEIDIGAWEVDAPGGLEDTPNLDRASSRMGPCRLGSARVLATGMRERTLMAAAIRRPLRPTQAGSGPAIAASTRTQWRCAASWSGFLRLTGLSHPGSSSLTFRTRSDKLLGDVNRPEPPRVDRSRRRVRDGFAIKIVATLRVPLGHDSARLKHAFSQSRRVAIDFFPPVFQESCT